MSESQIDARQRPVISVVEAHRQTEGGGFVVRRPFPTAGIDNLDPFLLLDEMGPADYGPGEAIGAPDHPHRGFETVTYLLDGAMEHRDSTGAHGVINPGAVQWMTAGAGVVHSEMPTSEITERGGRAHGFQIWVNLRAADKMIPPRYQGFEASQLTHRDLEHGGRLRVIAGSIGALTGPVETTSPATYGHASLALGDKVDWDVPTGQTAFVYVFSGGVTVNGSDADDGQLVLLSRDEGGVTVASRSEGAAEVLLLAGEPLGEPVARYGPFVMNTRQELIEAFDDYQAGRLGSIPPVGTGVQRD
ncbi:MAG: pirin family protein [Actinomycetota bacterium]|nr:pirin family protein [Actinomycetota bacterium]